MKKTYFAPELKVVEVSAMNLMVISGHYSFTKDDSNNFIDEANEDIIVD